MMQLLNRYKSEVSTGERLIDEQEKILKRRFKYRQHLLVVAANLSAFAIFAYFYPQLPAQLPSHWNFNGEIESYMAKQQFIGLMFLPIGLYIMMEVMPKIDPRKSAYNQHYKAYGFFELVMVLFIIGMQGMVISVGMGVKLDVSRIMLASLGLLFMVIGNFMPQVRPNYFFGIKTPWTLANEEVWRRTHRIGGFVYTVAGLTAFLANFFISKQFALPLFIVFITTLFIPVAYSYAIFKKK